jgi:hypothetical protein
VTRKPVARTGKKVAGRKGGPKNETKAVSPHILLNRLNKQSWHGQQITVKCETWAWHEDKRGQLLARGLCRFSEEEQKARGIHYTGTLVMIHSKKGKAGKFLFPTIKELEDLGHKLGALAPNESLLLWEVEQALDRGAA